MSYDAQIVYVIEKNNNVLCNNNLASRESHQKKHKSLLISTKTGCQSQTRLV